MNLISRNYNFLKINFGLVDFMNLISENYNLIKFQVENNQTELR